MITNEERIKALRCQFFGDQECSEKNCPYCGDGCMPAVAAADAANTLEFLQRVIDTLGKNHQYELDKIVSEVKENMFPMARAENVMPHWIPVGEEYPNENEYVLCRIPAFFKGDEPTYEVCQYYKGSRMYGDFIQEDKCMGGVIHQNPSHWMRIDPPNNGT